MHESPPTADDVERAERTRGERREADGGGEAPALPKAPATSPARGHRDAAGKRSAYVRDVVERVGAALGPVGEEGPRERRVGRRDRASSPCGRAARARAPPRAPPLSSPPRAARRAAHARAGGRRGDEAEEPAAIARSGRTIGPKPSRARSTPSAARRSGRRARRRRRARSRRWRRGGAPEVGEPVLQARREEVPHHGDGRKTSAPRAGASAHGAPSRARPRPPRGGRRGLSRGRPRPRRRRRSTRRQARAARGRRRR